MTKALLQNYLTTLFGILAGLPLIVSGSGLVLDPIWSHRLLLVGGIGVVGLGVVAKAFNTHSTEAQTQAAQAKVEAVTPVEVKAADVQAKAADAQVAGK